MNKKTGKIGKRIRSKRRDVEAKEKAEEAKKIEKKIEIRKRRMRINE